MSDNLFDARFLRSLRPRGWGDWHVEPFEDYRTRVRPLLPSFPDDVLEEWLYRHYGDAVSDYGWMGLQGLYFESARWSTGRLLTAVGSWPDGDRTSSWTQQLRENLTFQESWLGRRMIESGTWPVRILVLENLAGLKLPNGVPLAAPFHLMEGHHRFGYLRALRDDPRWEPEVEHDLWIVRPTIDLVRDYWPQDLGSDV